MPQVTGFANLASGLFRSDIMKFSILFFSALLMMVSGTVSASDECDARSACIESNSWQVGVAIGIGGRTNPLVDGDTIPFILLPDIAWYGDSAYFDNGELGYQWQPTSSTSVEAFVVPNFEKANFSFWHVSNLLVPAASYLNTSSTPPFQMIGEQQDVEPEDRRLSVDDIESRKWALDAGIRWQWYQDNHHIRLMLARDISSVYDGFHAALEYRYYTNVGDWQVTVAPQLAWKSRALTDYYYGVRSQDAASESLQYDADGGFQPGISVHASYPLTKAWHVLTRLGATRLQKGMTDSPVVEDNMVYSAFAGVAYRF